MTLGTNERPALVTAGGHLYKHCDEPRDTRDIDTVYVGISDRQNPVTRNVAKFQLFQSEYANMDQVRGKESDL